MTLLTDLDAAIASVDAAPNARDLDVNIVWGFLCDHGPALRQAVLDAERYRWLRDCCEDEDILSGFAFLGDSFRDSLDVSIDKEIAKTNAASVAQASEPIDMPENIHGD